MPETTIPSTAGTPMPASQALAPQVSVSTPLTPQQVVEIALEAAKREPGHRDCLVYVSVGSSVNLRWANNALTTNGASWATDLGINAVVDTAAGPAIAFRDVVVDNLDAAGIEALIADAFAAARDADTVEDTNDMRSDTRYGNWDAPAIRTDAAVYESVAPALGHLFQSANRDGFVHFGYAEHSAASTWIAASSGLRARCDSRDGRIEMTEKSADGSRSAWEGHHTESFTDIDLDAIDAKLRQHLVWQTNRIDLPAGEYTTVLSSGAVGDMMAAFAYALSGRDAHEGRSAFSAKKDGDHHDGLAGTTRIAERLASLGFDIYSDPTYPGLSNDPVVLNCMHSPEASLFDNGTEITRTHWVRDGVLTNLANSRLTAAEYGAPFVPDQENMIMELPGATMTEDELIAGVADGLYVTCLWYIRTLDETKLSATGLTRDGVYVIKDGKVIGCANNFRFNESTLDMLTRVRAASVTKITQVREHAEYLTQLAMPALVVERFNMASVSDAN